MKWNYYPHIIDEETKDEGGYVICPGQSTEMTKLGLKILLF